VKRYEKYERKGSWIVDLPFAIFTISFHYSTHVSSVFITSFHYLTDLSSIFSLSFQYSTYFSSINMEERYAELWKDMENMDESQVK
jgi:hypothetical protein